MGSAPRALFAGGLGIAAAFLVACGGGGAGLLSSDQAGTLSNQLDQLASAPRPDLDRVRDVLALHDLEELAGVGRLDRGPQRDHPVQGWDGNACDHEGGVAQGPGHGPRAERARQDPSVLGKSGGDFVRRRLQRCP